MNGRKIPLSVLISLSLCFFLRVCRSAPEVSSGTVAASKPLMNWREALLKSAAAGSGGETPIASLLLQTPAEKRGSRAYNFGLGKKSMQSLDDQDVERGIMEDEDNTAASMWPKRVAPSVVRSGGRMRNGYSFGLGKRGWFSSNSYPASSLGDIKRRYSFGLGKRSANHHHEDGSASEAGAAAATAEDDLLL